MIPAPLSLRRRLLLWLVPPFLGLAVLVLVDQWFRAADAADQTYDRVLGASAMAIAERIVIGDDGPEIDLPYVALEILGSSAQDRVYYKVIGPGGHFLTGYRDLPLPETLSGSASNRPIFRNDRYKGAEIRVAILKQTVLSSRTSGDFIVAVAQTTEERHSMIHDQVLTNAIRLILVFVVAAAGTWLAVTLGLRPLDRLRNAIRNRTASDLSPLDVAVPRELGDVTGAINQFMVRLGHSLESQEAFIADASHQLRTPLAVIRAQTELGLRGENPQAWRQSLQDILATTKRTSRLAEQLLIHARVSGGARRKSLKPVEAGVLVQDVVRQFVPLAARQGVDMGIDRLETGLLVEGDPVLLTEMLKNLVDNSLHHGRPQGVISLRAWACDGRVRLEVEDDGPGIAADHRDRVFERFYQIPGTSDGSGLGLAIVAEIVHRHRGAITLDQPPTGQGLRVIIDLPMRATERAS